MGNFAELLPFVAVAVLASTSIAITLRNALPAFLSLRQELAECPDMREVRYMVREVRFASRANVVELPVRQPASLPGRRAAA